jgi:4-carboxymuconolactone decarboxylase
VFPSCGHQWPTGSADERARSRGVRRCAGAGRRPLIPQGLYDRAIEALGHDGITDLIVLMGYYTCVSLTMNFYAAPVSGGGTPRY